MALRLCYLIACRALEILGSLRRTGGDKDVGTHRGAPRAVGVGHQNLDRCPELAVLVTSDHDRPWPSPSVTSACSDPLGGPRRTRTSRSWCSATGAYPRAPTQCARRLSPCESEIGRASCRERV